MGINGVPPILSYLKFIRYAKPSIVQKYGMLLFLLSTLYLVIWSVSLSCNISLYDLQKNGFDFNDIH